MADTLSGIAAHIDTVIVIFSLLILAVLALFSLERTFYRFFLMFQVRRTWFPEGRFVLFAYPPGALWEGYVENELLPEMADAAVVVKCPLRTGTDIEAKVLRAFNSGECRAPLAIVFKPYFEYEKVEFADAFENIAQGSDRLLSKKHARLTELVKEQRERMSLYF